MAEVKKEIKYNPLQQGSKPLCGPYSLINSLNYLILNSKYRNEYDLKKLRSQIILLCKTIYPTIWKRGTTIQQLEHMMNILIYYSNINLNIRKLTKNLIPASRCFQKLYKSFNDKKLKTINILMQESGRICHWTSVYRITEKTLFLNDSCGMKRINERNVVFTNFEKLKQEDIESGKIYLDTRYIYLLNL